MAFARCMAGCQIFFSAALSATSPESWWTSLTHSISEASREYTCWNIWKEHNRRVFEDIHVNEDSVLLVRQDLQLSASNFLWIEVESKIMLGLMQANFSFTKPFPDWYIYPVQFTFIVICKTISPLLQCIGITPLVCSKKNGSWHTNGSQIL